MKVKRQKHVRKILTFYKSYFGFHSPYEVVVDGTFCRAALNNKVNINEQLPKYLDAEVKLCTTRCVLAECEALGPLLYGPLKILQQYTVVPCKHKRPILPFNCLRKMAIATKKGKMKYFIATQDETLTEKIRKMPGVGLLYIAYNAINLEGPSDVSKAKAEEKVHESLAPASHEMVALNSLKESVFGKQEFRKKKKKKKGPNPLSCKKKKSTSVSVTEIVSKTSKRRKRHKKSAVKTLTVAV